ncbi:MAG: YdcF family protein [Clostridia bacterium]|nr:YdcF family protein [Clostridia bacterium]
MIRFLKILFKTLCVGAAAAFLFVLTVNGIVCFRASRDFYEGGLDGKAPDYILVLGCGLNPDRTPGGMLSDRIEKAIELYREYGGRLLMSGDNTSPYYDEPGAMKRMAVEYGVPPEDIVTDPLGTSTAESVYRAKEEFGAERIVIVTQKYHLYRAVYLAQSAEMEVVGVKADGDGFRVGLSRLARETAARVKDFFPALRRAGK